MEKQSYDDFWQKIHFLAKDKEILFRVMFELTYRCNFNCGHCYLPQAYKERKGELNTGEVFSILDQLKEMGCLYLGFTGGEPFMRSDIMDILRYSRRCGFEVIVYTNGSLIDKKTACELSVLRLNKIDITIPAMSEYHFERVVGASGWRDKVFKAIRLLHKKGVNLGFKSCLLEENEAEIESIQEFSRSLGALHRLDGILFPRLDGSIEPYIYRGGKLLRLEDAPADNSAGTAFACRKQSDRETINVKGANLLFFCGAGTSQAAITPLGELKICLMVDYPKLRAVQNLKESWGKLKAVTKNIHLDENYQCHVCELKQHCQWCPARGWLYSRSFTSCDPESRLQAKKRFSMLKSSVNA